MERYQIQITNDGYMIYDTEIEDNIYDENGSNLWDTMDEVNNILNKLK
jgi:hypothetical protein